MQSTMKPGELDQRLKTARIVPGIAHLPAFGLVQYSEWDYHSPELIRHALLILRSEGIECSHIEQTAPALFWYYDSTGELQLHEWSD
jgi:hypothetical protein